MITHAGYRRVMIGSSQPEDVLTMARVLRSLRSIATFGSTVRFVIVLASVAVFISCITQIAFLYGLTDGAPGSRSEPALDLLLSGVIAVPLSFLLLVTNPFIWAAALLYYQKRRNAAFVAGAFGVGVMWLYDGVWFYDKLGVTAWFANPAIITSWMYYLRSDIYKSLICAVAALVLMLYFLRVHWIPGGINLDLVVILSHGTGYWLWVASAAIMVVAVCSHSLLTAFRSC